MSTKQKYAERIVRENPNVPAKFYYLLMVLYAVASGVLGGGAIVLGGGWLLMLIPAIYSGLASVLAGSVYEVAREKKRENL